MKIASYAQLLETRGVAVSINLRADRRDCELYLPVLQHLAPYLHQITHRALPAHQQLAAVQQRPADFQTEVISL